MERRNFLAGLVFLPFVFGGLPGLDPAFTPSVFSERDGLLVEYLDVSGRYAVRDGLLTFQAAFTIASVSGGGGAVRLGLPMPSSADSEQTCDVYFRSELYAVSYGAGLIRPGRSFVSDVYLHDQTLPPLVAPQLSAGQRFIYSGSYYI